MESIKESLRTRGGEVKNFFEKMANGWPARREEIPRDGMVSNRRAPASLGAAAAAAAIRLEQFSAFCGLCLR
jgi:hypothetical protein